MSALRQIFLIVIYVIGFVASDVYDYEWNCKDIESDTPLYKLKRYLFCDYDPGIRPGHEAKNTTDISTMIIPQKIVFDEDSATLEINTWLYIEWMDPYLTWKSEDHGDISRINVKSRDVWIPELYSLNTMYGEMTRIPETVCSLLKTGELTCFTPVQYTVSCVSDYTRWPWDLHNCTLQLAAWAYIDEEISFNNRSGIVIDWYEDTEEWVLSVPEISVTREKSKFSKNATFPTFTVSTVLTRIEGPLKSVFITPVIILTVVTLTILWLRPGSPERLMLACFNFLSHLLIIRDVHYKVPNSGSQVPNILIFYTNSFILSFVVLVLTCWLQKILEWKGEVPTWLASKIHVVLTSKVGKILSINVLDPKGSALLEDDADDNSTLVDSQPVNPKWENVVTVMGWFFLFSFGFIYFVMSLALLC
ncbi:neuronal acetylcholine receptor subunit alpha-2-like [Diachasmimorpha longicaudata]|uniref:neuronal acetylcholine receptor subunit alpha-2-like n=1 Tax=Diachasmimorpha longicaudata TaxID=58733 RepID=UPI0030B87113